VSCFILVLHTYTYRKLFLLTTVEKHCKCHKFILKKLKLKINSVT